MILIDKESLIEHMRKAHKGNTKAGFKWDLECTVAVIETVDEITPNAEPIKHGHWEALYAHEEPTSNVYRCSNCGEGFADYLIDEDYDYYNEYPVFFEYDRCPHCGAIMDSDTVFPPYRSDGNYSEYWSKGFKGVEE